MAERVVEVIDVRAGKSTLHRGFMTKVQVLEFLQDLKRKGLREKRHYKAQIIPLLPPRIEAVPAHTLPKVAPARATRVALKERDMPLPRPHLGNHARTGASVEDLDACRQLLESGSLNEDDARMVRLRVDYADRSLSEIAERGGWTKDRYAARLRRVIAHGRAAGVVT